MLLSYDLDLGFVKMQVLSRGDLKKKNFINLDERTTINLGLGI